MEKPDLNRVFSAQRCRYYLRNSACVGEPLVFDDQVPSIVREMTSVGSVLLMRHVSSLDVAVQLTRRDFDVFRSIQPAEYISDLFELEAAGRDGHRPSSRHLDRFSEVRQTLEITLALLFSARCNIYILLF